MMLSIKGNKFSTPAPTRMVTMLLEYWNYKDTKSSTSSLYCFTILRVVNQILKVIGKCFIFA